MSDSKGPIYLDYQATTPVDPKVLEAMIPYFTEKFGNPASKSHSYGQEALKAVEEARSQVAKAINAKPQEIIFTSGATEAINLAIKGVALNHPNKDAHFITVCTEHKAVLDCFQWLEDEGYETTILPVNSEGLLDPETLKKAIQPSTVLVAVMAANNEIGVLQPIDEIGAICREHEVYFLCDATQALGSVPVDVVDSKIALLAASGHKIYGPKGIGFLYLKRSNPKVNLSPIIHGGGHERGLRSGTLATPLVVGLGAAAEHAVKIMGKESPRIASLRDELIHQLKEAIPDATVNGSLSKRLPSNISITLPKVNAEAIIAATIGEISISSGSACTSTDIKPSHVLQALGMDTDLIKSTIRIAIGRQTTQKDLVKSLNTIHLAYSRLMRFNI